MEMGNWVKEVGLWKEIVDSRYGSWKDMKVTMEDRKSSMVERYLQNL